LGKQSVAVEETRHYNQATAKSEDLRMAVATKTVPERLFFCIAEEVAQPEIGFFAQRAVGPLYETLKAAGLEIAGDLELICPQWNDQGKSRVLFAVPIEAEKPVPAPYFFWKSPAFKCAWTDHTGSMPSLKSAWAAFGSSVQSSGFTPLPTRAWREVYKHWESFNSEKDVTELQLEIE
jgi:predicted transcriptional regulator YdeE